jgi:hypothetical protein
MIERRFPENTARGVLVFVSKETNEVSGIDGSRTFVCAEGPRRAHLTAEPDKSVTARLVSSKTWYDDDADVPVPAPLIAAIEDFARKSAEKEERSPEVVTTRTLSSFVEFRGGYVAGFDMGEWGGAMMWFPPSGEAKVLARSNTHAVAVDREVAYGAHGLAHMFSTSGSITRYEWRESMFQPEHWGSPALTFPAPIEAIHVRNGEITAVMNGTPVFVSSSGVATYRDNARGGLRVQRGRRLAIDAAGRAWIGGVDQIGVWEKSSDPSNGTLFMPVGCRPRDWDQDN